MNMKKIILLLSALCFTGLATTGFASVSEKAQAASDQVTGSAESTVGEITGNDEMKSEGQTKKLKGDLRQTKEDIKDKLSN
jgi:uncharacterized protein YjbJ (UPF0337 family)